MKLTVFENMVRFSTTDGKHSTKKQINFFKASRSALNLLANCQQDSYAATQQETKLKWKRQ